MQEERSGCSKKILPKPKQNKSKKNKKYSKLFKRAEAAAEDNNK